MQSHHDDAKTIKNIQKLGLVKEWAPPLCAFFQHGAPLIIPTPLGEMTLWREASSKVKNAKFTWCPNTFGSWDVQKVDAAVEVSKSKCPRHLSVWAPLEVEMLKKCPLLWHKAHLEVKTVKTHHIRTTFGRANVVLCGTRNGFCTWSNELNAWVLEQFEKRRQARNVWRRPAKMHLVWQAQYTRHLHQTC